MVRAQYRPPLLFISFDKNSFIIPYPYPYPYPYLLSLSLSIILIYYPYLLSLSIILIYYPYLLSIALILYSGLLLDYIDLSILSILSIYLSVCLSVCLLGGFISSCDPCSVLLFIGLNYFCAIRG